MAAVPVLVAPPYTNTVSLSLVVGLCSSSEGTPSEPNSAMQAVTMRRGMLAPSANVIPSGILKHMPPSTVTYSAKAPLCGRRPSMPSARPATWSPHLIRPAAATSGETATTTPAQSVCYDVSKGACLGKPLETTYSVTSPCSDEWAYHLGVDRVQADRHCLDQHSAGCQLRHWSIVSDLVGEFVVGEDCPLHPGQWM